MKTKFARKLLGEENLLNNPNDMSPFSMIIFCKSRRDQEFIGLDVEGMSSKYCDEYFPTPTNAGMCMTKNTDMKQLANFDNDYSDFLEIERRFGNDTIEGGNRNAESTTVLMTDIFEDNLREASYLVRILQIANSSEKRIIFFQFCRLWYLEQTIRISIYNCK